jgi:hypothetical protein
MERHAWTDERIDERMTAIETTFARIFEELAEIRSDIGGLRADLSAWQRQIAQIGWALVGTLSAALVAALVAVAIALS